MQRGFSGPFNQRMLPEQARLWLHIGQHGNFLGDALAARADLDFEGQNRLQMGLAACHGQPEPVARQRVDAHGQFGLAGWAFRRADRADVNVLHVRAGALDIHGK